MGVGARVGVRVGVGVGVGVRVRVRGRGRARARGRVEDLDGQHDAARAALLPEARAPSLPIALALLGQQALVE